METLRSLLYDQDRIVTALTLSRHANISLEEAVKHVNSLYAEEKGTGGLNAVFNLVGLRHGESDEPTHILVRETDLEQKKAHLAIVKGESIFSLQNREVKDLYEIIASDDVEDKMFFRSDSDQSRIISIQVCEFRRERDEKYGTQDIIPVVQSTITKQSPKITSIMRPRKEEEISKLFKKSAEKDYLPGTPKGSPAKPVRDSPFSSREKRTSQRSSEDSNSPVKPKRRTKKILLDEEEDSSPEKKEKIATEKSLETSKTNRKLAADNSPSNSKKKEFVLNDGDLYDANVTSPDVSPVKESEKKEERGKKKIKRTIAVIDDDLYDANASSPDVSPVKGTKKKEDSEKKKAKKTPVESNTSVEKSHQIELRRSPRKKQQSDLPPGKKRVCRRVTESYQDEDGFLVTREVMRDEIVDIPEEELQAKPLAATSKLNKELSHEDKKAVTTKKAQSKISSFFTKK